MEIDDENVAEIEKYAFLLGSSIKNEDLEQFFSIYDSILPKDLPDNQVELIKSKAREVSELPDCDFNNLVLKARTFSLAPTGSRMSYCESKSKWALSSHGEASEKDDEGIGSHQLYVSDTVSLHSATKVSTRSSESEFRNDSGVGNSSKATNSVGSISDDNPDDDERTGTIDYFPIVKIRSGCGICQDYDEAYEVKSDHSSADINSPRSDISDGVELTTFSSSRHANEDTDDEFNFTRDTARHQDDFNTDGESDEDSYHKRYYNMGYRPLERESQRLQSLSFDSMKTFNGERSTSGLRGSEAVDKGINFSLSGYSRHSSDPVKIEKNSYKRDPPFGQGPEQIQKVGNSVDRLIKDRPIHDVKDMPEGRKLELLQPEESKKKKKKKKAAKDDGSVTTDENGNPIAEGLGTFKKTYAQMRESPTSSHETYSYGTFSGSIDQSSSRHSSSLGNVQDKRKRKKKTNNEDVKKAEDIANYKGDKSIEEVMSFIGGQNESNKKSKKPAATTDDIPSKTQKASKKSKDKKQKSSLAVANSTEVTSKGAHSAQEVKLEEQVVSVMGNSGAKSDSDKVKPVENGDIAGMYSNREKIAHSLLKTETIADKSVSVCDSKKEKDLTVNNKEIIPKDEIVELTNNQTDDPNVGIVKIENNKKKAKVPKAEKTEMTVSKSEEDSSGASSATVKQKNAKNKKSKPSSPTVKTENESEVSEVTPAPCVPCLPSDDLLDNFIFTDLDLKIPKEEDFQVVGKKKKKTTKETIVQQNHFIPHSVNNKSNRRLEEKRSVAASINHKIAHNVVSSQVLPADSDGRMRDLSPSAFPALTGSKLGRQAAQEGRRNSTGDVPIPTGLKSQDDSDIESVKSLPATQGSGIGDGALSPRFSYARMAASATAKPIDSEQLIEQAICGNCEHEAKKAVWKGSSTERRHSIGSSPEVVNKNTMSNSLTVGNTVKGGCQDHILADAALKPKDKKSVGAKTTQTQTSSGSNTRNVKLKVDNNKEDNAVPCGSDTSQSESSKISANAKLFSSPIQSTFSFIANLSPDSASIDNSAELLKQDTNFENSSSFSSSSGVSSVYNASHIPLHKQENRKNRLTNCSNGKKQKSVIFLDKRVEETPNLGISFGFDSSECGVAQSEKALDKSEAMDTSPEADLAFESVGDSKNLVQAEMKDIIVTEISFSTPNTACVTSKQLDTERNKLNAVNDASSGPLNKSQIVRLNGLVSHASQGDHSDLIKEEYIVPSLENSSEVKLGNQKLTGASELGGEDLVYYGECVTALKKLVSIPSPTNGPHLYCGLARFKPRQEVPSNFNINEAAYFLTREWDETMKLKDTDPESVVFLEF